MVLKVSSLDWHYQHHLGIIFNRQKCQLFGPTLNLTESEIVELSPGICVLDTLPVTLMHTLKLENYICQMWPRELEVGIHCLVDNSHHPT